MSTNEQKAAPAKGRKDHFMMAWRVHEFGPPDVMAFEKIDCPQPGPGEVLIRVRAVGVGPWDGWIRAGKSALPQPLPLTLGSDLSGIVESVGPDVRNFATGDEVFGVTNGQFVGAYAEYAIASAKMIAKKPVSLDYNAAASVPVVAVTAWQALFEHGKLAAGQIVIIHGGAGSVGAYAVQLAHRAGIRVVATASAADLAYVRSLGADEAVDYKSEDLEKHLGQADVVIDLVGGRTQDRSFNLLRRGGKLVSAVSQPDQEEAERHGVEAFFFLVEVTGDRLAKIADFIDNGKMRTQVGAVLSLAEARTAHEMLEGILPRPRGKIVLDVPT
ncbi:NADP-dependent oxidoreductase [Candidatus Phyllobacterium onerii]|uniref:NADP-dependent oxidoreductase n=1 Tax=Candidatus Phyllobacterium onerii TaxID=3020828 RepID=UPI003A887D44